MTKARRDLAGRVTFAPSVAGEWMRMCASTVTLVALLCAMAATARAQEEKGKADGKAEESAARSKAGKKLFGTAEALRIARAGTPRISPDGTRVAYLATQMKIEMDKDDAWKNVTQLWVAPTAGPASAARQFTRGEKSVGDIAWSPDGQILAFSMQTAGEKDVKTQVWFMYANGGEPWQVTKHKSGVDGFEISPDGKTLLLTATVPQTDAEEKRAKQKDDAIVVDHDLQYKHLWTWDVATGAEKQITKGDFTVGEARWSPDGKRVTYTEGPTPLADDSSIQTVWVVDVASGEKRKLVDTTEQTNQARWSEDGKWIAFVASAEPAAGQHNLYVVSADGGKPRKLTGSFELSVITPYWSPDGKAIYFSATDHEANDVFAADVAAGSVRKLTKGTGAFELTDVSKTGNRVVGVWSDPTHPEHAVSTDLSFQSMTPLSDLNAWLADYELANEEVVKWKSSKDGWDIEGVLVKPVGFDTSRKWPFLLRPHGGPTGATVLAFDPTSQIMAANGYLQLEPNFRGSTGRGEKFSTANENDWGNGDYKDDMSGVQAMVDKGWADADRMGAFGWSYGGYMTFWIDTQTDKFKAISPGAGLPDLYSMYSQSDIHRYMRLFFNGKAPWDNFDEYWEHSPMKYVNNVKTPTMILHGQADTRVPNPQGEEFYRALVERHVPVEYVVYPRENHGFSEGRHQQDRWQRYLVFFGKYLNQPAVTEPKEVVERMGMDLPR